MQRIAVSERSAEGFAPFGDHTVSGLAAPAEFAP
jgi:hypothetical protein